MIKEIYIIVTLLILNASASSQIDLNQGLIAAYPMDGNSLDTIGGHHGTVYGGVTLSQGRYGQPGGAYSFDGVDDYIEVIHNNSLRGHSSMIYTFVVGFKPGSKHISQNGPLIVKWKSTSDKEWGLDYRSQKMVFGVEDGCSQCGWECKEDSVSTTIGNWHLATVTVDVKNHTVQIWMDGVNTRSCYNLQDSYVGNGNADIEIGRASYKDTYFEGDIDFILIYDRILNPEEIDNLWKSYSIGIEELSLIENFKLYPNPSKDMVYVDLKKSPSTDNQVMLYDVNGKLLYQRSLINPETGLMDLDLKDYPKGLYIIRVRSGENTYQGNRVIKF